MGDTRLPNMAPSSSLLTASILLLVMFADAWWQRFAYTPEQSRSCRRAFKDSLKHGYRVPPLVVKNSYGYRNMSLVDEVIPETKLVQAAVVAERPATPATDMVEPIAGPAKEEALVSETTSESTEDLVESAGGCDPCDEFGFGDCCWDLEAQLRDPRRSKDWRSWFGSLPWCSDDMCDCEV